MPCHQENCHTFPIIRYTWPGKKEARSCLRHAMMAVRVVRAFGLQLELLPLRIEELCEEIADLGLDPHHSAALQLLRLLRLPLDALPLLAGLVPLATKTAMRSHLANAGRRIPPERR